MNSELEVTFQSEAVAARHVKYDCGPSVCHGLIHLTVFGRRTVHKNLYLCDLPARTTMDEL